MCENENLKPSDAHCEVGSAICDLISRRLRSVRDLVRGTALTSHWLANSGRLSRVSEREATRSIFTIFMRSRRSIGASAIVSHIGCRTKLRARLWSAGCRALCSGAGARRALARRAGAAVCTLYCVASCSELLCVACTSTCVVLAVVYTAVLESRWRRKTNRMDHACGSDFTTFAPQRAWPIRGPPASPSADSLRRPPRWLPPACNRPPPPPLPRPPAVRSSAHAAGASRTV